MRKYIKDLDYSEIRKLLDNNSDIKEKVFDRALDDAYFWVGEYLEGAPRKDVDYMYFDRGEHFTVKDATREFMDWIEDVQYSYEWLDSETYEKCKRAYELWKDEKYTRDLSDDEWTEYETLKKEIGDEIFSEMKAEYNFAFDRDHWCEVFDSYVDEFIPDYETAYVDTDTWEIHDTQDEDDPEYGIVDDDLSEQMTFL